MSLSYTPSFTFLIINFNKGVYSYCPCASLRTSYKSNLAAAY